jgi:hypothetical protein
MRTAVLVVHGIGSQRPLETVRGVINAVWFDNDDHEIDAKAEKPKKIWSHPEPSGVDIDLTVGTTNAVEESVDKRSVDFHELYWAHLMSETKAVAVLLWLFELARKGPRMKEGMNGLWWSAGIFLCLMLLSTTLLLLQAVTWLTGIVATPYDIVIVLALMLVVALIASIGAAIKYKYLLLACVLSLVFAVIVAGSYASWRIGFFDHGFDGAHPVLRAVTDASFTPVLAFLAAFLLMRKWGAVLFAATYGLSLVFFAIYLLVVWRSGQNELSTGWNDLLATINSGRWAWSLSSQWSSVAAWTIIGVYVAVNAAFLQPYLGDAARYFRNSPANVAVRRAIRKESVDTLASLHASGYYDRIVVVAHSLGSIVAYDMLRAYYSRICDTVPVPGSLEPEFSQVDKGGLTRNQLRTTARALMRKIAKSHPVADPQRGRKSIDTDNPQPWLVTDFVTLGAALTHASYLMCDGKDGTELKKDFDRRVAEREFPMCPPDRNGGDGWLSFKYPNSEERRLHHGGLFALTRWTNLYFPLKQVFWGDAIGGKLDNVFGGCIKDVPVWTDTPEKYGVFTHTDYWCTTFEKGRSAPHIAALREAINLADT